MTEDWIDYFKKSSTVIIPSFESDDCDKLLSQVTFLHDIVKPNLEDYKIAVLGVADGRNSLNKGVAEFPNQVRPILYGLRSLSKKYKILDLGNVLGKTLDDRYKAIEEVVRVLVQHFVLPIVIGGSQDYTIPIAGAIKTLDPTFRISVVDAKIDWGSPDEGLTSNGFMDLLFSDERRRPYDLSLIGVQKYLYGNDQEEKIKKASFDFLRLGKIKQYGMEIAEPWVRDADVVSFDFTSVKQSDQPAHNYPMPNGFSSDEFCQLSWYAGISDKIKVIGFFEMDVTCDQNFRGIALGAQAIWHALEGCSTRYNDFPVKELDSYPQYIVHLNDYELDIKFYNNPENNRWWVEVPGAEGKFEVVACCKADFEEASKNEIPERWFRFINKKVL